jgi:CBS domain-containing protein
LLLLAAAATALVWAEALRLDLSVAHWTADGLLAIFFFVAGAELKRELVVGELRHPGTAALPVIAAACGMAVPALVYGLVATSLGGTWNGWAVPMATDIAFALGVLAVIDTHLPSALRAFLLTLAVVDDLGAIIVIALFYTSTINLAALIGAVLGLVLFFHLHDRRRVHGWYWYLPLALAIWGLMYNSGVHATVAGVANCCIVLIGVGWIAVLRGALSGLWLALIGFFVMIVATAERQHATLAPALRGVRAADAMSSPVETCHDWLTVQRCIDDVAVRTPHSKVILIDFQGRPSGLLHLARLAKVPALQRESLRVRDVAIPWARCTTCAPDDELETVLEKLSPASGMPTVVTDGQQLVGIITEHDISRLVQRRTLRGTENQ